MVSIKHGGIIRREGPEVDEASEEPVDDPEEEDEVDEEGVNIFLRRRRPASDDEDIGSDSQGTLS